jgi:hypothetical protein
LKTVFLETEPWEATQAVRKYFMSIAANAATTFAPRGGKFIGVATFSPRSHLK